MSLPVVSNLLSLPPKDFFLFGMRWSFGPWFLYVGITKWLAGPATFIAYMSSNFEKTWLPLLLVQPTGWVIVLAEPILGIWLWSGKQSRLAWALTAKLMFILLLGQTVLKEYGTVANNWQYFVLALACAALSSSREENFRGKLDAIN